MTICRLFHIERVFQTILTLMKVVESSPKWWITLWEKGEIAHYEQFLLFPTVFSKDLYWRHVNSRACLGKG